MAGTTLSALRTELAKTLMDPNDTLWSAADKTRFINAAIRYANGAGARRIDKDESLVVIEDAVAYDLWFMPTDGRQVVFAISVANDDNEPFTPYYAWEVIGYQSAAGMAVWTLVLPKAFTQEAGRKIRIEFLAPHPELANDSDETFLPEEYVIAYATWKAYKETRARSDVDRRYYQAEAQEWLPVAEAQLQRLLDFQPNVGGRAVGQIL